ncbi:Fructose-1-phosphate phosphatase YqaB [bacterium HR30]|nr:Fructose-1-phosphate phosphatase YqaB [bacterium HR30]
MFDLDGVLLDSEELHYRAYSEVLAAFGVVVGRQEYAEHWIAAGHGPEYAVETYSLPVTPAELRARKAPVYRRLLQAGLQPMPGAQLVLEQLSREFALGIATNSSRADVDWVLSQLGWQHFFEVVVGREDYREAKPAPDAYLTARSQLAVPPEHCLVVEDSPRGVLAARAAGLRAVAVPNEFTRVCTFPPGTELVEHLSDITPSFVRLRLERGGAA